VVPRSGVVAVVPRSVARWRQLLDLEGERWRGPCAGKQQCPRGPEEAALPRRASKRCPRHASSNGATRDTRFEHRHERREVRAATIMCDILRSSTVQATRVTTSICSCVFDNVLWRLPPPIRVAFRLLCFIPKTCTIYSKTIQFYAWTWSSYISLLLAYFCMHIGKTIPWFMLFIVGIKNQIKSFMFITARFLHLP
jgi:hypothetical protein